MIYLSKSKYCELWQCPKIAWLRKYKPDEFIIGDDALSRMEVGNEIGDFAMGLFGDYVEVTEYNNEQLNLSAMIENTKHEMEQGTPVICEASFEYDGLYCAVDILKKEDDGWAIYEVKSSSTHKCSDIKPIYIADISYQKYVLENCGVKVTGTYIITINGDYVFDGTLDLHQFFNITDISHEVSVEINNVSAYISIAERILNDSNEPDIDLSVSCQNPYPCGFWKYCSRNIPVHSVFDLYRMPFKKKIEYYRNGKYRYEDLLADSKIENTTQLRQMEYTLEDKGTFINRYKIRDFLSDLSFPIYFLDFETIQPVIPEFTGTKPYEQIPFQYSLHYIDREGGELKHKEFLAESGTDPRRPLAEQLCQDIPMNVCVTAYNKHFECSRLKDLARIFPDLSEHLLNIRDNIKDLLVPFQSGYYYNRKMGGSFSIKSVLPAIFPDDPALDYHNLEDIHNGSEAMSVFPKIQNMTPEEQTRARHNLLKYCELDTYAMVKIWEELVEVSK